MSSDATPKNATTAPPQAGEARLSFETAAERLASIVAQIERGDLPLEKSLELFEQGTALAREAQARLDEAERRVEELLSIDSEGRAQTRPFEP